MILINTVTGIVNILSFMALLVTTDSPNGFLSALFLFASSTAPKIFLFSSVITAQYTGGECERGKQLRTVMP